MVFIESMGVEFIWWLEHENCWKCDLILDLVNFGILNINSMTSWMMSVFRFLHHSRFKGRDLSGISWILQFAEIFTQPESHSWNTSANQVGRSFAFKLVLMVPLWNFLFFGCLKRESCMSLNKRIVNKGAADGVK